MRTCYISPAKRTIKLVLGKDVYQAKYSVSVYNKVRGPDLTLNVTPFLNSTEGERERYVLG